MDRPLTLTGSFSRRVAVYRAAFSHTRLRGRHSVTLPSIDHVKGQTTIRGGKSMSCSTLNSLQSDDVYHGGFACSSSARSLSPGARGGIAVGVVVGVLLLMLLLWHWLRQRPPSPLQDEKPPSPECQAVPSLEPKPPAPSIPRRLVEPPPALLDGQSIHEAAYAATPIQEYHELDAGAVFSTHQRPINADASSPK